MMNSSKILFAVLLIVACMCGSCSSDDEPRISAYNVPMRKLTMNLRVSTEQANEASQSTRAKAPQGDPGLRVDLAKPSVLYVVVWCKPTSLGGKAYMQAFKMAAPTWSETTGSDKLGNEGLWLEGSVDINIPRSISEGRVMMCASATDLGDTSAWGSWPAATGNTFKGEPYKEEMDIPENMLAKGDYASSCEAVKDITFNLPDLSSTPEDYSGILGSIFSNAYDDASNGNLAGRDRCDLVLYHTAAMLDMTWNVNPTAQQQSKVGPITVKNLRSTGIHPFAPASADHQPTTTRNYSVTITPNVGQQWAGREYIYVAQYGGTRFPLVYDITNGHSGTTHANQAASLPLPSNLYTSWMRYNLRLNY